MEEPFTQVLLSCLMIEVQPLEEVSCSSCLLFISTHIPRIIFSNNFPWYYQSSKYYIWHSSQSPKNIITDQSKASMLPIKKKHYQSKYILESLSYQWILFLWLVSRPDTIYRYHQLWIKNVPLPFTRISFDLLSPEQVIKQTRAEI